MNIYELPSLIPSSAGGQDYPKNAASGASTRSVDMEKTQASVFSPSREVWFLSHLCAPKHECLRCKVSF